jgi:ATP-dependent DNA helicase RecG
MRRVWRGGPELHADIALAVTSLKQLTPQVSSTNEIATVFGSTIDTLLHLPRDERARREVVTRLGQQLQATRPHIGAGDAPADIGKLNTTLGEKRAGRPSKPRAPRVTTVHPLPPDALITELPHVGASFAKRYQEGLHLHSIEDVLRMVPRRHIDYSHTVRLDDPIGLRGEATVRGKLVEIREIRGAGTPRVQARIFDGAGSLRITWFSTFIARQLAEGDEIVVSGLIQPGYGGLQMTNPEWERVGGAGLSTGRLIPVYSLTKGVAQKSLRTLTRNALDATRKHLVDWLADAREFIPDNAWNAMPALEEMYENIHYPASMDEFKRARARLMFENLFLLQLGMVEQKKRRKQEQGRAFDVDLATVRAFYETLPFTLTRAQSRAIGEILSDVRQDQPMTRLLQGDVGSGKTVVAATIALVAKQNGLQAAIMAPTELLAEQHATNLESLYAQLPEASRPRLALLTGSTRAAPRRTLLAALDAGEIDVLIGTHALIQDDVAFAHLGLVVIDEQHRFGVRQRGLLTAKAHGFQPHLLSMTATPIPRTLNLVLNGDLDVSIIDERPPGRIPIETRRYLGQHRVESYQLVREQVAKGHQVFVICPLVEESDTIEAKAAVDEAQRLQEDIFPDLRVDVLHGKMSSKNKDDVMNRFRDRQFDILVSTSVIEVGIDIPNATVMMIEGADRFGLAQLHQFRGRVGRGGSKSYCLLLADDVSGDSDARLHTMVASDDGFVLAERDLELRGPGDFLGTRQSGLPELGWLEQGFDTRLLDLARESAERLIAVSPNVDVNRFQRLKPRLQRFWATRQEPENNLH